MLGQILKLKINEINSNALNFPTNNEKYFLLKTTFCGSHYFKVILELGFIQGKTILSFFYFIYLFCFPL